MSDKKHIKEYGIYYWDTFDNETLFLKDFDSLDAAKAYVEERYQGRLRDSGADKIDIVTRIGSIVKQYPVG